MKSVTLWLWAILIAVSAQADMPALSRARGVLPDDVRPVLYRLTLTPHPGSETLDGTASIDIDVRSQTTRITLNATELVIASASMAGIPASAIAIDAQARTATLTFEQPIAPGPHTLDLAWNARFVDGIGGMFAVAYEDGGGPHTMAVTQFEPATARRVAPLWDEPGVKTPYDVTMIVPAELEAISNMPAVETTPLGDGTKRVHFATTPAMSSYLLFFGVGDFERVTAKAGHIEIGVVTRRGHAAEAAYALKISTELLAYYEDYFAIPFPLPKMDHIAAPGESNFSAMENWGANFYFESGFFATDNSPLEQRQYVFADVAHEMAHQWFGNLVTMSWWDDLWLNEGFATWMQGKAAENFHPEWNIPLEVIDYQQQAMALDSSSFAEPIVRVINSPAQAPLDDLTYQKGRAVVRMMEAFLGEVPFRDGIRLYLGAHQYGNATREDLWAALYKASGVDVSGIGEDFTTLPGIPLIRVESVACVQGHTEVAFTQDRFAALQGMQRDGRWHVPVTVQVIGGGTGRGVIAGSGTIEADGCGPVKINPGHTGYYRTLYANGTLAQLLPAIGTLGPADRNGLIYDTKALLKGGYLTESDIAPLRDALSR